MSIEKEFEGETVTDAAIEACKELGISRDELEFDVIQEELSGVLGIGSRKAIIRVISKDEKYENKTDNSIDSLDDNLNIDVESVEKIFKEIVNHFIGDANIDSELNGKNILLKLNSEKDLGFLIGRKGEMIKNLEFLLSRISSKQIGKSIYVSIDINSYREKRMEKLKEKVLETVKKVIAINRPLSLNPMNSFERREAYLIIEQDSQVTYKTKEYGKLKKITIFPKDLQP
ncbi:Jag N-terminal domain-containing protein [bacterium]|nr:Jag N-terminal domain-containing protein [bacterium]|tara:strand:+ start:741 stop:1430 length:690 start_codon:yes stop_codon:yes gene_type:complete